MITQLSVFLANEKGRMAGLCRTLADADINMHSLFVADTEDFGVVRIFCDTPLAAAAALREAGYRAGTTKVLAVRIPNRKGGLADLMEFLDSANVNVEYCYCFLANADYAIDALKVAGEDVEAALADAGFDLVKAEEIYRED